MPLRDRAREDEDERDSLAARVITALCTRRVSKQSGAIPARKNETRIATGSVPGPGAGARAKRDGRWTRQRRNKWQPPQLVDARSSRRDACARRWRHCSNRGGLPLIVVLKNIGKDIQGQKGKERKEKEDEEEEEKDFYLRERNRYV